MLNEEIYHPNVNGRQFALYGFLNVVSYKMTSSGGRGDTNCFLIPSRDRGHAVNVIAVR